MAPARAVTGLALLLLVVDGSDAPPSSARVNCATINEELASGKTYQQVADEMDVQVRRVEVCDIYRIRKQWGGQPQQWSTCAAITAAVATGRAPERVAAEMNVPQQRAMECDECVASGTGNRTISKSSGDVDGDGKRDKVTLELHHCDPVLVVRLTRLGIQHPGVEGFSNAAARVLGVVDVIAMGSVRYSSKPTTTAQGRWISLFSSSSTANSSE